MRNGGGTDSSMLNADSLHFYFISVSEQSWKLFVVGLSSIDPYACGDMNVFQNFEVTKPFIHFILYEILDVVFKLLTFSWILSTLKW